MTTTQIKQRVEAGAAFLSSIYPKWFKRIDLEKLDLSEKHYCVLGELEGDFFDGIKKFNLTHRESEVLGFERPDSVNYSELTRIWKRKIRSLLRKS